VIEISEMSGNIRVENWMVQAAGVRRGTGGMT